MHQNSARFNVLFQFTQWIGFTTGKRHEYGEKSDFLSGIYASGHDIFHHAFRPASKLREGKIAISQMMTLLTTGGRTADLVELVFFHRTNVGCESRTVIG